MHCIAPPLSQYAVLRSQTRPASPMRLLARLFARDAAPAEASALYAAVVTAGRAPHWYVEGRVPDTLEGRFSAIATVLSMVLLRLEREPAGAAPGAWLTERFVEDMDGQLREIGIGDMIVGKKIGMMMGMLGGRLGAYRTALAEGGFTEALIRNLHGGENPGPEALAHSEGALRALDARLAETPLDALLAGRLPQ
jgi:cytochrome b pre-mRNA-processing protein 3